MRDRSIGRRFSEEQRKITFADVAGQEAAVAELREIKEYLAEPKKYASLGAAIPRGVLLYGPPGCGKTLMARALANEANAAFISVGASEFAGTYVGQAESRVRDLFSEARQMAPAIVFIDELDSLGRSRTGVTGNRAEPNGESSQALNQMLAELDGFSSTEGIILLGATNRPDVLDPALLRPGRFDRSVGLELPNESARRAILDLHAKGKTFGPDVDLGTIADRAHGMTGADLANILNEAALLAARADRDAITQAELDTALKQTLQAPERQRRLSLRSRSIGKRFTSEERITFADVAGADDAVEELGDVRDYLSDPDRYARMSASPPRGILLSGPPGCGKTLLARAVAGEANAAFISAAASEFVEVFVGEGSARVRDLFAEARSMAPAIVFIDEIDAVGGKRSSVNIGGTKEREDTLNQILVELDGFEASTAVIVIAATNRPDMLDSALVRAGRFDRKVEMILPDRAGRRAILEVHARGKPLADDVDLDALAGQTQGFSGADLANVLNEAAMLATRRRAEEINMALVDEAIDRAYLGISGRGRFMTDEERRRVAYHEAGHALVASHVEGGVPPYKLTIAPRGGTLGHCAMLDTHDRMVHSRSMLIARMAVSLGGWAAEKLVYGENASGVSGDLRHMNEIARRMVCDYGMSDEVGPIGSFDSVGLDGRPGPPTDEEVRAIRRLGEEAGKLASAVLEPNRAALDRLVEGLLERETLTAAEVQELVSGGNGRKPVPVPAAAASNGEEAKVASGRRAAPARSPGARKAAKPARAAPGGGHDRAPAPANSRGSRTE
ncbi:MAG: AAA family ATPase [Acidimicrobiales bacterium]